MAIINDFEAIKEACDKLSKDILRAKKEKEIQFEADYEFKDDPTTEQTGKMINCVICMDQGYNLHKPHRQTLKPSGWVQGARNEPHSNACLSLGFAAMPGGGKGGGGSLSRGPYRDVRNRQLVAHGVN
jgi:hypothetical protein